MAQEETKTDYMTIICMLIGFVMLIYIGLLALFMFYPPAFKSLIADPMFLYEKFRKEEVLYSDPYRDILWATNPDKPKGVTVNTEQAYQGATLFESTHFKGAVHSTKHHLIVAVWVREQFIVVELDHERNLVRVLP